MPPTSKTTLYSESEILNDVYNDTTHTLNTGGGSGGGAVTAASGAFVDGSIVAQGSTTDAAYTSGSGTMIALLKGVFGKVAGTLVATVTGNVATQTTDSGNPVKVGGVYAGSNGPTLTTGQRGDLQMTAGSNLKVQLFSDATTSVSSSVDTSSDGAGASVFRLTVATFPYMLSGSSYQRVRLANTFKTATATSSGNTAVWTPTTGKKFRLMRYMIQVTGNAAQATGGTFTIDLQDSTTSTNITHSFFVPGTAGTSLAGLSTDWVDLGNGVLSSTINNVLNVNLSAALTSGVVRVVICGTEE